MQNEIGYEAPAKKTHRNINPQKPGEIVGISKIGVKPPKWMVKIMENPIKMDDLGVPLFLETPSVSSESHVIISCRICGTISTGGGFCPSSVRTEKSHLLYELSSGASELVNLAF